MSFPFILFGQEVTNKDSLKIDEKNLYIKDYTNQLNIKLELSNDIQKFTIPFEGNSVEIEPNLGLRYAAVFSYKFLTVRLGIRPRVSGQRAEEKGESKSFRMRFNLLFDKWSHNFEYNRVEGYYISNSDFDFIASNSDNHFQFPELVTNIFSGTAAYKLNDNYSVRATISQTEAQLKSAGSLIPSVDYSFYKIDGLDTYINTDGDEIERNQHIESSGFNAILNLGYYYTFVYKKWYASAYAIAGVGMDFNNTTKYVNSIKNSDRFNDLVLSAKGGTGIGYNSEKFFFGASYNKDFTDEKYNENKVQFQSTKNTFYVFFGYRFKAPKQIAKPIDGIEEKIPILK